MADGCGIYSDREKLPIDETPQSLSVPIAGRTEGLITATRQSRRWPPRILGEHRPLRDRHHSVVDGAPHLGSFMGFNAPTHDHSQLGHALSADEHVALADENIPGARAAGHADRSCATESE